jgi:phosphoribosylanthranilate isomerase
MNKHNIPTINKNIKKVGVFVDPEIEYINKMVNKHKLDFIQLHGNETPKFISKIKDIKIIKAFAIDANFNFSILKNYLSCDYFLFDTAGNFPGGNGISFDWNILSNYKINKQFFLSGGVGIKSLKNLKIFLNSVISKNCVAVDINSQFEIDHGIKDFQLIKNFINEL